MPEPITGEPGSGQPPAASFASGTTRESPCEPTHDFQKANWSKPTKMVLHTNAFRPPAAYTSKSGPPATEVPLLAVVEPSMRKPQFDRTLSSNATTAPVSPAP